MSFSERWRRFVRRWIWIYPPFLFSGIGVRCVSKDPLVYRTTLKCRFWNQNAVGTHFGGSLFAMTDPFYMLILMEALGRDYVVWDQASTIEYIKAGKRKVSALFEIPEERIEALRVEAEEGPIRPVFTVEIKDDNGEVIARVHKTLYVRLKRKKAPPPEA